MTTQSAQRFLQTVLVTWPAQQQARAKAHLISVAKKGHAEIMRGNPGMSFEAYANTPGRPVESVVLPGPIVYRYHRSANAVVAALELLRASSPVVSGAYRDSHTIYVDGTAVATAGGGLTADALQRVLQSASQVMIANPLPYARRLEIGVTESGRPFVVQVAPRIYGRVFKRLRQQFGDVVGFEEQVDLPDAGTVRGVFGRAGVSTHHQSGGRRVRRRSHGGETIRSPALIFKVA